MTLNRPVAGVSALDALAEQIGDTAARIYDSKIIDELGVVLF